MQSFRRALIDTTFAPVSFKPMLTNDLAESGSRSRTMDIVSSASIWNVNNFYMFNRQVGLNKSEKTI